MDLPDRLDAGPVVLRRPRAEDAEAYLQAFRDDPALGRLLGLDADPQEPPAADRAALVVADPRDDRYLGEVLVFRHEERHRRCEIGFWLVPDARGRGIGTAAVGAVLDWAFAELGVLRVEMTTTPENPGVPALAARLGFTREGVLRKRSIERDERVDIVWFGLLREEWSGAG